MTLAVSVASQSPRRFFVWMAVALALGVLWGFGPTYFLRPFLHTRDISWVVHVHALVYIGWISLFLVQATLVARNRTDLHRQLGVVGAVWGALVVVVGIWAVFATMRPQIRESWDAVHGVWASSLWLAWSNAGNPIMFGLLFAPAVALRRRVQAHKRLMLLACLTLMNAPMARAFDDLGAPIVLGPFGFTSPNSPLAKYGPLFIPQGFMNVILLPFFVALVAYDLATTKRVHPATIVGGLVLFFFQFLASVLQWPRAAVVSGALRFRRLRFARRRTSRPGRGRCRASDPRSRLRRRDSNRVVPASCLS
jgi:hypothetical protein